MTIGLFTWWAISISWNIAFLIAAGFYLYASSRAKRREDTREENKREILNEHSARARGYKTQLKATVRRAAKNFIFVWILLGLLVFYIFSVQMGTGKLSEAVFAVGNITVEALLVLYLVRNRDKIPAKKHTEKTERELHTQTPAPTEN